MKARILHQTLWEKHRYPREQSTVPDTQYILDELNLAKKNLPSTWFMTVSLNNKGLVGISWNWDRLKRFMT